MGDFTLSNDLWLYTRLENVQAFFKMWMFRKKLFEFPISKYLVLTNEAMKADCSQLKSSVNTSKAYFPGKGAS